MKRLTKIELFKENMKFSAGHFTVFSATRREKLHGHNFTVHATITAQVDEELGMTFDYGDYKEKIVAKCKQLSEIFLLPKYCPYLTYEEEGDYLYVLFNDEKIPFLKKDVLLLPVTNITVEELSRWFVEQLMAEESPAQQLIEKLKIKIFSGPGNWGSTYWRRSAS